MYVCNTAKKFTLLKYAFESQPMYNYKKNFPHIVMKNIVAERYFQLYFGILFYFTIII